MKRGTAALLSVNQAWIHPTCYELTIIALSWHRSYTIIELRWCSKAPHMDVFRASRPQFGRVPSVKSIKHRQTRKRSSREAREVSLLLACATDRADYRTFSRFDISISLNLSLGRRMFFSRGKNHVIGST